MGGGPGDDDGGGAGRGGGGGVVDGRVGLRLLGRPTRSRARQVVESRREIPLIARAARDCARGLRRND